MSDPSVCTGPPLAEEPSLRGRPLTLGGFLHEVVRRDPACEAIVTERSRLTYGQLLEQSVAIARALVAAGAGKGSRVALLLPNGPQWATGFFGCGLIGAIAVAVNALVSDEDLEHMLLRSDTQFLLTSGQMLGRLEGGKLLGRHPRLRPGAAADRDLELPAFLAAFDLDQGGIAAAGASVPAELITALADQVTPTDDALIMFTSGSTGRPKAVLHAHRAICIQSWRWPRLMELSPADRLWSTSPFFWSSGLVRTLGSTLAAGATLVLQEHFEPGGALAMLEREAVTAMLSRPHLDNRLLTHPAFGHTDLSSLRLLEERSPLRQRLTTTGTWDLFGYGMTETMTLISMTEPGESAKGDAGTGHPLCDMTVKIADTETGQVVPRGVPGRICVRGVTLMRGYYKVPAEEFLDPEGWFLTSDAGFIDDVGHLHWTGRLDDMAKVAGVNVYPIEVERQLARWGRLSAYSVLSLPHPALGTALVLCAALTDKAAGGQGTVDEDTIRQYLRSELAGYAVPRRILLFRSDELSFTATQKVDLRAMRAMAVERILADDADADWSGHLRQLQESGHSLVS